MENVAFKDVEEATIMKGPGLKLGLEVRRLFRCPETSKSLWANGDVTTMRSPFSKKQEYAEKPWMILIEEKKARREIVPVESFSTTEMTDPLIESKTSGLEPAEEPTNSELKEEPASQEGAIVERKESDAVADDSFAAGLDLTEETDRTTDANSKPETKSASQNGNRKGDRQRNQKNRGRRGKRKPSE